MLTKDSVDSGVVSGLELPGRVLILYNRLSPDASYREADAGVLEEVAAVEEALSELGIASRCAAISCLDELPDAVADGLEPVVFNLVENLGGMAGDVCMVPAVCRSLGRMVTGCDSACLMLTADKWQMKAVLSSSAVPVPLALPISPGVDICEIRKLPPAPWIVKPLCADASEGIVQASVVNTERDLLERISFIHENFAQAALVEQFIVGRELNISLLETASELRILPFAEIDFSNYPDGMARIVDYAAKWDKQSFAFNNTPRIIPAALPEAVKCEIEKVVMAAWRATACRDYARVDLRLDEGLRPWVLELNANPDISSEAGFAAALEAAGISYRDFVRQLLLNNGVRQNPVSLSGAVPDLDIRRTVAADRERIMAFLAASGFFREDELNVAGEVLDDAAQKGAEGDYRSYAACQNGVPLGWVCFGSTPCSIGTWDIYWLGTDPAWQGRGIGRRLMAFAECEIRKSGGRLAVVETAGREDYEPTRAFYRKIGYRLAGRIADFYAPGDAKLIYLKRIENEHDAGRLSTGTDQSH